MFERKVCLTTVVAATAWIVGIVVVMIGLETDTTGLPALGLWLSGLGGVLAVRESRDRAIEREREAFEMGRAVGRVQSWDRDPRASA